MTISSIAGATGVQLGVAASELSADRLTTMAADVVAGRRPSGPPPAGPPPGGPVPASEDSDDDTMTPLEQLAADLGIDSATLLDALESLDLSDVPMPSRWDEPGPTGGFIVDIQA